MENEQIALEIRVYGIVQGVGFRSFARKKAHEYGIKGYIRNLIDGSVEVIAEGDKKALENFLVEISRGPVFARVDRVEKREIQPRGFKSFEVRF